MDEEQSHFAQSKINPTSSVASDGDEEGFVDAPHDTSGNFPIDNNESQSFGSRKLTSKVWNYFEQVMVDGIRKAKCKKCNKLLSGTSSSGTTHLKKHAENTCTMRRWLNDEVDIVKSMAKRMIEKFDKYWEHINGLLAIAAILDPRNKMDCVEHYFKRLYVDDGEIEVERVRLLLNDLVVEYQKKCEINEGKGNQDEIFKGNGKRMHSTCFDDDEDEYAQLKKTKKRKVNVKGELDHYLEDRTEDEDDEFDILTWWKIDRRYPTLRKIAKDILAIPISSVASESAFSMGGRVVSPHRSRLHANTVEALMCLQNWKMQDIQGDIEDKNACSTINDDSDLEGDKIDTIDLDVDDIPIEDMEEDESQEASFVV